MELMNFMYRELDKRDVNFVSGLFVDLTKAFDTVSHDLLAVKLEKSGMRGCVLELFVDYLKGRYQAVSVGDALSTLMEIKMGVIQGSALGPTLFLIFINDIQYLPLKGALYLFADDAALFYSGLSDAQNCLQINHDLSLLSWYFDNNLLSLNKSKTKYMHFHGSTTNPSNLVEVNVGGEAIERVESIVYLGLHLDKHLNFGEHVQFVCTKVTSALAALYKVRFFVPREVLRLVYFSLIHSHIVYMCSVWGQTFKTYLRPIQVLQNRALKVTFDLPHLTPTTELYGRLVKVLPVRAISDLQTVKLVRQILNDEIHHCISLSIRPSIQNLRDTLRIGAPRVRTSLGGRQMSSLGPRLFNRLPIEIRKTNKTREFIHKVKKFFQTPSQIQEILNT